MGGNNVLTPSNKQASVEAEAARRALNTRPGGFPIAQWTILRILAGGEALQPLEIAGRAERLDANAVVYTALAALKKRDQVTMTWELQETRAIRRYAITDAGREELDRLRRWLGLEEQIV